MKKLFVGKFASVYLLFLLGLGLFASITTTAADLPEYPAYTSTISYSTWLQTITANMKPQVHGLLNRTGWYQVGWNLTDDHYGHNLGYRWTLSDYLWNCIVVHNLTQNAQWLAEISWLVDNYLAHENDCTGKPYSWSWVPVWQPTSSAGWIWHDSRVWMAMHYLNQHGFSYDLDTRLNYFLSVPCIDNSTDLAWLYDWHTEVYDATAYVVNAFTFALPLFGYLQSEGYGDYTANVTRIYTSIERFRAANHQYKYKMSESTITPRYTCIDMVNLLIGYKYFPSVFNLTKFQQTINSFNLTNFDTTNEYDRQVGAGMFALADYFGLTLPSFASNVIRHVYDFTCSNHYSKHWWNNRVFYVGRYYMDCWTDLPSWALSFVTDGTYTFPQITDQQSGVNHYYRTRLDNNTYYAEAASGWLKVPFWSLSGVETRLNAYPVTIDMTPTFNNSTNRWEDTATYLSKTMTFTYDKYGHSWNVSYPDPLLWRIFYATTSTYTWNLIFSNGTLINMPADGTYLFDTVFAVECRSTATSGGWYLFKTNNATIVKTTSGAQFWLATTTSIWEGHQLLQYYMTTNPTAWLHIEEEIAQALTRWKNGEDWVKSESIPTRTQSRILHSDANITAYSDTIANNSRLTFSLNYGSGQTSQTYVYVGDEGEPTSVSGATSWSYNSTTKILTITVLHSSPEDIEILWATITPVVSKILTVVLPIIFLVGIGLIFVRSRKLSLEGIVIMAVGFLVVVILFVVGIGVLT